MDEPHLDKGSPVSIAPTSDAVRSGRLDPTGDWNQPLGQPLYPPLPWYSRDGEHVMVVYETELDAVREFLPYELEPAHERPQAIVTLGRFEFCSGGGPYAECFSLIPV